MEHKNALEAEVTPARKFLILLKTTTNEKIAQYSASARLQGLPLVFVGFNQATSFHSEDEEKGDRVAHAHDKNRGDDSALLRLRNSPSLQRKLCEEYGVPFDPQNILIAAEDSSLSLPEAAWRRSKAALSKYLRSDILANAEKDSFHHDDTNIHFVGPGAEIGPVMGAVSIPGFFKAVTDNVDDPIYTLDSSTMVIRPLMNASIDAPQTITGTQLNMIVPRTVRNSLKNRLLSSSADYLSLPEKPEQPLSTVWAEYLTSHSPRAKILLDLYAYARSLPYASHANTHAHFTDHARKATDNKSLRTRIMWTSGVAPVQGFNVKGVTPSNNSSPYLRLLDLSPNFGKDSHAYVFSSLSDNKKDPKSNLKMLRRSGYNLFSGLVEKQLQPQSANKPLLVVNDSGSDPHLAVYAYLVNTGMAKDIDLLPEYEQSSGRPIIDAGNKKLAGIEHKAFGMLDVVQPREGMKRIDHKAFQVAASKVLARRFGEYCPYVGKEAEPHYKEKRNKRNYRNDIFKVAVFTSASSDNRILLDHNLAIGRGIAKIGAGLIWGAGDRHAMGAVYDGYRKARGVYVEGYSTPSIVVAETKNGCMPECSYSEISPHIFERMAKMIESSDVITLTPGGWGTVQEVLAVLILMDEKPELMAGKSIIFHNPVIQGNMPFWDPIIKTYLGESFLKQLKTDSHVTPKKQFYMTDSVRGYNKLIGELKEQHIFMQNKPSNRHAARPAQQGRYPVLDGPRISDAIYG